MLRFMRQVVSLLIVALTVGIFLTRPIRSQQIQRKQGIPALAASRMLLPFGVLAPQNLPSANDASQAPLSPDSGETSGPVVILDPAHGGADFGARGPTGLAESDVVLDFARAARIALEAQRLRVLLTREGNQDPGFDNRSAMANGLRNAVFISIHVASGGPVGTARTYYYAFSSDSSSGASPVPPRITSGAHNNLIPWDVAQQASLGPSRELAGLMQTELVRRFQGSPEMPISAPVRQLRTIAAPAIAIELSSIDMADAKRLEQMAQPLADAIGRAVAEFHYPAASPAPAGAH